VQGIIAFLSRYRDGLPHFRVHEIPVTPFPTPIDETRQLQIPDEVSHLSGHSFSWADDVARQTLPIIFDYSTEAQQGRGACGDTGFAV
jgi:hypothetical protein